MEFEGAIRFVVWRKTYRAVVSTQLYSLLFYNHMCTRENSGWYVTDLFGGVAVTLARARILIVGKRQDKDGALPSRSSAALSI